MVYTVEDLTRVQCAGDKDLHNFRYRWNNIVGNMADQLPDRTLENILVNKLANARELTEDLATDNRTMHLIVRRNSCEKRLTVAWSVGSKSRTERT